MQTNKPLAKNIALAQLTRIGDVIQTWEAARSLKKDYPEAKLFLIARKGMAKGLEFLLKEAFDEIAYVDVKEFIPSRTTKLEDSLNSVKAFASRVEGWNLDLFVNLSFNKSSSYLSSLVKAKNKMGISRNEMNQLAITDKWSQYVYSSVMSSVLNPFSLVDIYKFILGAKTFAPDYAEKPREDIIVIHPFASAKKKKWGANKWIDLLYKVLKENPEQEVRIVGGPEDVSAAEAIINSQALTGFRERIVNHAGEYSIEDTYRLLEKSKLLLCHDSMVSHLAAATQTPTVVLSMGTVRPDETTPYQRNVINIVPKRSCFPCSMQTKCDLLPCHKDVSHQLTGQIVSAILKGRTLDRAFFTTQVSPFYLNSVAVFAPHFGATGMELIDIAENPATAVDVFKTFYRILWSFYLRGVDASYPLPSVDKEVMASLVEHQKGCGHVYELYNFAMKYARDVVEEAKGDNPDMAKIQERIHRLSEIDELSAVTKKNYPLLKPIVDFFFVNKANAMGNNIIDITESNILSLHEGQNLIKIMFDLIERLAGPEIEKERRKEKEV